MFFSSTLSKSYYNCIENPKSLEKTQLKYTIFYQNNVRAIRGKVTHRENCTVVIDLLDIILTVLFNNWLG